MLLITKLGKYHLYQLIKWGKLNEIMWPQNLDQTEIHVL